MSEQTWLRLAELASQSTPLGPLVSAVRILRGSVEETAEELRLLIEAPLIAGQGFLERAERESAQREELILEAQRCFTKLIRHPKPMLASRANFFVGFCHVLLGNPRRVAVSYYAKAFSLAMTAVENSEAERAPLLGVTGVSPWQSRVGKKHGVTYQTIRCHKAPTKIFPVKDAYMEGLERVTEVQMLICCVDDVDRLCPAHRLDSSFVSGRYRRYRAFSRRSPYFMRKSATIAALSKLELDNPEKF